MKSAYELAMERLNKTAPTVKLSATQKTEMAELDSEYAAKIAAREIALNSEMAKTADDLEKEARSGNSSPPIAGSFRRKWKKKERVRRGRG